MVSTINNSNLDAGELFLACLAQATAVVKQVLPSHYANVTPDNEADVREVMNHMFSVLALVTQNLADTDDTFDNEAVETTALDDSAFDVSVQWQQAADEAELALADIDLEATVQYAGEQVVTENFLMQLAGDLLIHAWDLGEAIGMNVRFAPNVAEAVLETTVIPNQISLPSHTLFAEPISPPANADLQTRLLALFGRSHAWRTAL